MCAVLAAIGRTCDYKHHWQDVSAGSALGALNGWLGFRQFYPRLSDKRCGVSYIEQKALSDETEKIYDLGSISIDKRRRPEVWKRKYSNRHHLQFTAQIRKQISILLFISKIFLAALL